MKFIRRLPRGFVGQVIPDSARYLRVQCVATDAGITALTQELHDQYGWREQVATATRVAAGLSAAERTFMTELIMSLKPEITVVIIEHDIDVAFRIADQVSVLDHGAIIAEGSPKEIEDNPEVQQIYTLSRRSKDTQNA